ncbi:MAG: hypothetical protein ACUVXI_01930 [bacterium]
MKRGLRAFLVLAFLVWTCAGWLLGEDVPSQPGAADASKLRVDGHHIIIGLAEGGLRVQEIIVIRNAAPYTYVGRGGFTLQFSLPSGARDIGVGAELDEEGTTVLGDAILISGPVPPSGRQIIYRYDLPVDAPSYVLRRTVDYPTGKFDVFLAVPGASIRSDRLELREPLVVEGRRYLRLSGGDLAPATVIELTIEGLPQGGIGAFQVGVLVATAAIFAGGLIYPFVRRRGRPTVGRREHLSAEREALIEEIAALDDDFAAGSLPEEEYRPLREEKKRRLLEITRRIRSGRGGA